MYQSSRGLVKGLTFQQALFSGYSSDGGIVVPNVLPDVSRDTLKSWSDLSYVGLVKKIVPMFIPESEIEINVLEGLLDEAFGGSKFDIADVVRLHQLGDGCHVMELFHGPTMAFKDLALQCTGRLYGHFLERRQKHCTVVVGTSGDTGSAAIEAVKGQRMIDIIVLLPRGRCSRLQELQMTTAIADNVHVYRVDGTSDDLDEPIKKCFTDVEFVDRHQLCSINSINWTRIVVQIVTFFYAYLQMSKKCDGLVEIVVPTGACGHLTAGCIARKMGLPIELVATVNCNDVVARLVTTGTYSIADRVTQSLAPAMDIQMAYNVERLIWLFSDGDTTLVRQLMQTFEQSGSVTLPPRVYNKLREAVRAHTVDDDGIRATIKRCQAENNYIVCPHTATALHYHYTVRDTTSSTSPRVCIATASPAKFSEAMTSSGLEPVRLQRFDELNTKPTKFTDLERDDDWYNILRQRIEQCTASFEDRNAL